MGYKTAVGVGTTTAGGAATIELTASGSPRNARARLVDVKFASTDASSDYTITDADGKAIFADTGIDGTAAVLNRVVGLETLTIDSAGDPAADTEGSSADVVGRLPFSCVVANGGATLVHTVTATIEV